MVLKSIQAKLIIALLAAVFTVGIFGVRFAHQGNLMEIHNNISFCEAQHCGGAPENPFCASGCISAFQSNIQGLPENSTRTTFYVFLAGLFFWVAIIFNREINFYSFESFIRKRRDFFIFSFFAQLGYWLIFFGKRDPSPVFALA